jgi:SAM-dependent methyltransferase
MKPQQLSDLQQGYDTVADEYARRIYGELAYKPLDRELLLRFATQVKSLGLVCELGCGPGHVARFLHDHNLPVFGVDLSYGMLAHARALNPRIEFQQADMRSLALAHASLGGIVAFYSIIHIPRAQVTPVLTELRRVLRPGGLLLLAFHIGSGVLHLDEWWGQPVQIDFVFFQPDEMEDCLKSAGFEIENIRARLPYPDVEHPSHRCYILARNPANPL